MRGLSIDALHLVGQPMFKLLEEASRLEKQGKNILHFEIGDPTWDTPGFIIDEAHKAMLSGETHYVSSMGIPELRDAICKDIYDTLGYRPVREQVLIAPANSIIYLLTRSVVNPGEEVIIPDPGFPTYKAVMACTSIKAVPVPLTMDDGFRMCPEDIEKKITNNTALIIVNSPSNPTGAVMSLEDMKLIFGIARAHDLYLLSDETYSKITYSATHFSPSVLDKCGKRTILLNSFSKTYSMSGWRLGYAVGPEEIIEKMGLFLQTIISCCPPFIQYAGIQALEKGGDFIKEKVEHLKECRDTIVYGLNSLPGVSCLLPKGAFYAFPNITGTNLTSEEFSHLILEEAGVATCPGPNFGEFGKGYVRFSYAMSVENIKEGIERMRKVLK